MNFNDMSKQEQIAWAMTAGSALIALYLIGGFISLLGLEDGVLVSAPGLLRLCIKASVMSVVLEIACGFIRRRRTDAVDSDERDSAIMQKANLIAFGTFGAIVSGAIFSALPYGLIGLSAISTAVLGGGLICLFVISTLVRHTAEVVLYRWA